MYVGYFLISVKNGVARLCEFDYNVYRSVTSCRGRHDFVHFSVVLRSKKSASKQ